MNAASNKQFENLMPRSLNLLLLAMLASMLMAVALPSVCHASSPVKPTMVTVPVPADTPKPPNEAFFTQEHIVPPLSALQAEQAQQSTQSPASATGGDSSTATMPKVFRTLGDAAKAVVNPMMRPKPISLGKPHKPVPHTMWTRIHLFVYAGIAFLILLILAYALFSPKLRLFKTK